MIDGAKKIVKNMRICCGDVELNEDVESCEEYCAKPFDVQHGEARFCRQWLMKDAADLIECMTELEPLLKAKEEGRLIVLPYAPGTLVYVVDDYEVVPIKYHPSMYGRRCHTSKEELYKEFYKEIGVEDLVYGTERKDN